MAVSVQQDVKLRPPCCLRIYAETPQILRELLPRHPCFGGLNAAQIVKDNQFGMTAPESGHNHHKPTKNEPCCHVALRVYRYLCTTETRLTHPPTGNTHKERPDDCVNRVLKIGDQLDGQQRKGASMLLTQKPGDGHLLFLKFREQINSISPVGVNFLITITIATDGTCGPDISQKIDRI